MKSELLRSKFRGALKGTFVGDAVGEPVEGWPSDRLDDALFDVASLREGSPERIEWAKFFGLISGDAI